MRHRHITYLFSDPEANLAGWASMKAGDPAATYGLEYWVRTQHPNYYDLDQLYDLTTDPGEQVNLATDPAYAGRLRLMKEELQKYLNSLPGPYGEFKSAAEELRHGSVFELR